MPEAAGREPDPETDTTAEAIPPSLNEDEAARKLQGQWKVRGARRHKKVLQLQRDLDDVKISTMHDLVRRIDGDAGDNQLNVHCVYLTNKQASQVTTRSMPKLRKQLGIRDDRIKMVIRLMPSHFGQSWSKSFPWFSSLDDTEYHGGRFPTKRVPELRLEYEEETEHQLILLAKEVLLPLASRTSSLIIGTESCSLTSAFVQVSAQTQRQLGDDCPFRLLIMAKAYQFHQCAGRAGTVANKVRQECPAWLANGDIEEAVEELFGEDRAFWPCEDLPAGTYSLVLFDCVSQSVTQSKRARLVSDVANLFQSNFLSSLSTNLPVIALQTYGDNKMASVRALAEHVNRNMPLMLLDSRKRPWSQNVSSAKDSLLQFSTSLHDSVQRTDGFFASALALVKRSLKKTELQAGDDSSRVLEDDGPPEEDMWLWKAIEHRLERASGGTMAQEELSSHETDIVEGTNIIMEYVGRELQWEAQFLRRRCGEGVQSVMRATTWEDLALCLEDNWCRIRGCCFHRFDQVRTFCAENTWAKLETRKPSPQGTLVLVVDPTAEGRPSLQEAQKRLNELIGSALQVCDAYNNRKKTVEAFVANHDLWLAVYDILKSPTVYAGSVHELKHINKQLPNFAKIDRLPQRSTLEALVLLRAAWTVFDLYNESAMRYKVVSKVTYFFIFLLGVLVVGFTSVVTVHPDVVDASVKRTVLLVLALCGSVLTAFTAIVDPARKWQQLRSGAYELEAEIWQFRTRVNAYRPLSTSTHESLNDERRAESALRDSIFRVEGRTRLGTGLKDTGFYSNITVTNDVKRAAPGSSGRNGRLVKTTSAPDLHRKHGMDRSGTLPGSRPKDAVLRAPHYLHHQYARKKRMSDQEGLGPRRGRDSHHAPAHPSDYIRWRLVPKMQFYQARIPTYAFLRRFFQAVLLISSLSSTLLAALNQPSWTGLIAAFTGAVAGWQEYLDVARKLQRYSTITASLSNILIWWRALTEVERQDVETVSLLVNRTESLLKDERSAWVSDAQQSKRLQTVDANVGRK